MPEDCPCGRTGPSGKAWAFDRCCGRYHGPQGVPAPDPEALMRSRYTAYVLGDVAYLLATWHPDTRPPSLNLLSGTRWLGLTVKSQRLTDATHGEVSFVARYREAGRGQRLSERSRFACEGGRWYYVDGDVQ